MTYNPYSKDDKVNIEPLIKELLELNNRKMEIPEDEEARKDLLQTLMTISLPNNLSDAYYELEKEYLNEKSQNKLIISCDKVEEKLFEQVYLFKGDITAIKADAIVNAANEKMLGCFVPRHHCIDNAIQMASGLGLRQECMEIMKEQGQDEEVGLAKITKGYNLPAKYVIHTVGPNVNGPVRLTGEEVVNQLRSCYLSILRKANEYEDIKNIVFCSISTGVYGVPISLASEIALITIKEYLSNEKHRLERVIIDVFSEEDYNEYKIKGAKI